MTIDPRDELFLKNLENAIDTDHGLNDPAEGSPANIEVDENLVVPRSNGRQLFDLPEDEDRSGRGYDDESLSPTPDEKTRLAGYKSGTAKVLLIGGVLSLCAFGFYALTSGGDGSAPEMAVQTSESPKNAESNNSEEISELTRRLAIANQDEMNKGLKPRVATPVTTSSSAASTPSPSGVATSSPPKTGGDVVTVEAPQNWSKPTSASAPTLTVSTAPVTSSALRTPQIAHRTSRRSDRQQTRVVPVAGAGATLTRIEARLAKLETTKMNPVATQSIATKRARRDERSPVNQVATRPMPTIRVKRDERSLVNLVAMQPTLIKQVRKDERSPVNPVAVQPPSRTPVKRDERSLVNQVAMQPTLIKQVRKDERSGVNPVAVQPPSRTPVIADGRLPNNPAPVTTPVNPYRVDLPAPAPELAATPAPMTQTNEQQVTNDPDTLVMGVRPIVQIAQSSGDLPTGVPLSKSIGNNAKIGQFIAGRIITPLRAIATNTAGTSSTGGGAANGTFAVQITSSVYASGGETLLPSGSNLVVGVTIADNGLVQILGIKAIVNGQEVLLPADAFQVETSQRQPLLAERQQIGQGVVAGNDRTNAILGALGKVGETLNRQDTSTIVSNGTVIQNTTGDPNILGSALEGGSGQLIAGAAARNTQESQRINQASVVWFIPANSEINLIIVKPFSF